ncbi:hypothetical protein F4782DRAFT_529926 [Xylaria castorea]|nr:hypothetical protein F4782DRAFT_529926 [Xylaria castorea]
MACPESSPARQDPETVSVIMATAKEQNHHKTDDAAMESQPQDTATDYTAYSTKGLYGIIEASVWEYPDRGTEAEIRLSLSAMEMLMDLAVAIALMIFMYYAYELVAEEYATNSHRLAPGSHSAMPVQCTCSYPRPPTTNIQSFMH